VVVYEYYAVGDVIWGVQSSEGTLGCFHLHFVPVGVACGSNMIDCIIVHVELIKMDGACNTVITLRDMVMHFFKYS